MQYPSPGYNDVPAYLASGLPFVTASTATSTVSKISFPYVTKFITIRADAALEVGFTNFGVNNNEHYTIPVSGYITMEVRVKEMYVKRPTGMANADFHLIAGLTGIPTASIPTLTGSFTFNPSDPYHTGSAAFENFIVYSPGLG